METEIGPRGYTIELKTFPQHFLENCKTELYVKALENPNFQTNERPYPVFRLSKTKIYLPRYYGIQNYGQPKKFSFEEHQKIDVPFQGTIRPVQQETIDATLKVFDEFGGGLISLDTGLGKTVVALKLISIMKVKTLVIVHADFLLDQWTARIKQFLPTAKIGIIKQDRCEITDCDVVIAMIQTVVKREYPKGTFDSFDFMQIDESHHVASRTFSSLFFKVQTKYIIGLSATPERKDGLSRVLYWFLGPQIIFKKRETGKPFIQFIHTDTDGFVEKFNRLGKVNSPEMITDLSENKERSQQIIEIIKQMCSNSRKILVISDRRSHCEWFQKNLAELGIVSGLYLGGMKTQERDTSVACQVIIGTYQAAGEGFDVPDLDTLILATPKSDVEQAVGRILRQKNENDPLVIDMVDSFSIFKGQYYKRRKFYKSQEFKII